MATFGRKQVLINQAAAWGMTGDATTLKIPGFGTFLVADMINVAAANGTAAVKGVYTYTIAGAPGVPANMTFVVDSVSTRWSADNVRFNTNPGNTYVFAVSVTAADTAATIAGKIRAQMQERTDLPWVTTGAAADLILTQTTEYTSVRNANTGFMNQPYVESAATKFELPGLVTATLVTTTAPATAIGLGKDLEENEFLTTGENSGPYAELTTDRPILGALYNEFSFDIPVKNTHDEIGADFVKGSVSFSVFTLKSEEVTLGLAWNAIGAKATEGWTPIVLV